VPRQPRYFLPDFPQHVIQRGVDRQAVFFMPEDYELYLRALRESAAKYNCSIHSYVLMTNHTHLLITPGSARSLPQASLVHDDQYLLACQRYIELNPVRSGIVPGPGDYPYSSFAHNALGKPDPLINEHRIYRAMANNPTERQTAYQRLFLDATSVDELTTIRETTNSCLVLGNDQFQDQIEAMMGRSVRHGKSGRPRKST
jgi:putative transposase